MEYLRPKSWLNKYSFLRDPIHGELSDMIDYNYFIGLVCKDEYDRKLKLDNISVDARFDFNLLMKVK